MLGNTRYFGLPDDFQNWVVSGIKKCWVKTTYKILHLVDDADRWDNGSTRCCRRRLLSLGGHPGQRLVLVVLLVCCCCSCMFVCCCGLKYSPWVAVLVSSLCLWFCLFALFVVVALVCLLLLRLHSFQSFFLIKKKCRIGTALNL